MTALISILTSKPVTAITVVLCLFLGIRSGYFKGLGPYLKRLSVRPYLLLFLVLLTLFVLSLFLDAGVLKAVQNMKHPMARAVDDLGGYLSKNTVFWMSLAVLYLISFALKRRQSSDVFFGALLATALTGIASQIIKFLFFRARPYSYMGPFSFFNLRQAHEHAYQSLPSGDVALIAGASFLMFYSIRNLYLKPLILILPLATAFFRIAEDKHWPSDTLVSMGIGLMIGLFVWNYKKIQI